MGKRKQSVPQKANETTRKQLTWNMLENAPAAASGVNILDDHDPALLEELEVAESLSSPKKQSKYEAATCNVLEIKRDFSQATSNPSYRRDDLLDIFDLHLQNCSFDIKLYTQQKVKKSGWKFELASFEFQLCPEPLFVPLPVQGLPNVEVFTLHISKEGEKNLISYSVENGTTPVSSKSTLKKSSEDKSVKFWLFVSNVPGSILEALRCRTLQVVLDDFDSKNMIFRVKVIGNEDTLTKVLHPSDSIRPRVLNDSLKTIISHFYGISEPCYDHLPYTRKHDIDAMLRVVKESHYKTSLPLLPFVQHPDLLPRLRRYQQEAITWMVHQEKRAEAKDENTGTLNVLYTTIKTLDGQVLYFNKYAGMLLREFPVHQPVPPGGILGDEMGMGKTVEVLGCMLHHPRASVPLPEPLPVIEVDVNEFSMKKKNKRKRKKKSQTDDSDSDDTIVYMDYQADLNSLDKDHSGSVNQSGDHADLSISQSGSSNQSCDKTKYDIGQSQSSSQSCDETKLDDERSASSNMTGDETKSQSKNSKSEESFVDKTGDGDGEKLSCDLEVTRDNEVQNDIEKSLCNAGAGNNLPNKTRSSKKQNQGAIQKVNNTKEISNAEVQFKNIFAEKPEYHQSEFECVCGAHRFQSGKKWRRLHPVQCSICRLWQHAECVSYNLQDPLRGPFKCPHCHAASMPIPSGATLIISPASISHQWVDEILKHVAKKALNVLVYPGVGNGKKGYIQPQTLACQDIVITTYETLRKELDYVDLPHSNSAEGRKLRHPKRFMAIPSPLTAVQWWRVCLDEAQMVECTTTKTAQMAQRLCAVNRWCVTGTPIQKDIEDLVGLLLFLGVDPYCNAMWWHRLLYDPYCHGVTGPMHDLLTSVLWRNVKADVLDQIDIPIQTEETEWLNFSPVEEHFYRRQYQACANMSMKILSRWSDSSVRLSSLERSTVFQMLNPLVRLRQACCHPQVVRGEFVPLKKDMMSMEDLLDSLIKKAKLEAEEAHRQLVAAINGQAGLHIIQEQYSEAVDKYREVLMSVEEHKGRLKTDSLQQLHAMYNLNEILASQPAGVAPTLRDDQLPRQIEELKERYLAKAIAYVTSTEEALAPAQVEVKELQREVKDVDLWFLDVIQWAEDYEHTETLLWKVAEDVRKDKSHFDRNQRERPRSFLERHLNSPRALQHAMHTSLNEMKAAYAVLFKAMKGLQGKPSQDLINLTVECCLRPVAEVLNSCPFCKTRELFESYESRLFAFVEKEVIRLGPEVGGYKASREGTWADSDLEKALKSLLGFAKTYKIAEDLIEYGTSHLKLIEAQKKEYKKLRAHWAGIKEHVATFDELDMSTTRLRLRLPDEPVPDTPQMNVLDHSELSQHSLKLSSDRIVANGELRRKLGQLLYLSNLAKNQVNTEDGHNPEACPICQQELGKNWSVMQCGHCFCMDCMRILQERAGFGRQNFTVKCAICRQSSHQSEISYVVTSRGYGDEEDIKVRGSHSTKVEAVVRCLLRIRKLDPTAKSLVFSTWVDVLSIIGKALTENDLSFKPLYASGKFQHNLSAFKEDPRETILLLPIHSGANGLNLIEATHVLLVEPVLNPAQELQAIGRVHRIGQTKPTYVHRFLVKNTIEQKMHTLLQSINVSPNVTKGADEYSLTIGDISALFSQQMETVDREGAHTPEVVESNDSDRTGVNVLDSHVMAGSSGIGYEHLERDDVDYNVNQDENSGLGGESVVHGARESPGSSQGVSGLGQCVRNNGQGVGDNGQDVGDNGQDVGNNGTCSKNVSNVKSCSGNHNNDVNDLNPVTDIIREHDENTNQSEDIPIDQR
ncbi:E3 ubiquitin-protein ligase SHPRH-like [Dreissena polymorpha]|uniref:E3 ubiquitin-protein ligase SHPRH n=1 Tax=Dreissena polymorpha TaxID=45954 RepID=A0A9D4HUM8_DREPO|nr:E3 ubiquitin-protein ligase SHPRH-like [Dreissena polymorpha]KAH3735745.1 hypothetical protein DPMN_042280 [Dreissena polymorpha]